MEAESMTELRPAGYTEMEVERLMGLADEYGHASQRFHYAEEAMTRAALKLAIQDALNPAGHRATPAAEPDASPPVEDAVAPVTWTVGDREKRSNFGSGRVEIKADGRIIGYAIYGSLTVQPTQQQAYANAALMARAPDLLAENERLRTAARPSASTAQPEPVAWMYRHIHDYVRLQDWRDPPEARINSVWTETPLYRAPVADDLPALCRELAQQKDGAYLERNQTVAGLAALASRLGCVAGIARTAIEGWSEDWHGCVYIDLPTGQVSWHYHDSQAHLFAFLPPYAGKWDGHDTPEKYRRVLALRAPVAATEATAREVEDARRYRWLRECSPFRSDPQGTVAVVFQKYENGRHKGEYSLSGADLDSAIDAARAASTGGSNAAIANPHKE